MRLEKCNKCGEEKELKEFYFRKDGKIRKPCKKCMYNANKKYNAKNEQKINDYYNQYKQDNKDGIAKYHKGYYQNNRSKIKQYSSKYYEENKESILEKSRIRHNNKREKINKYKRDYYKDNKESFSKKHSEYYINNKEDCLNKHSEWRKNNPDKVKEYRIRRRGLENNIDEVFSHEDIKAVFEHFDNKCFNCGSAENLCIDHHRPLCNGNGLSFNNAVLLCKSCNSSKHAKIPEEFYDKLKLSALEYIIATLVKKYEGDK